MRSRSILTLTLAAVMLCITTHAAAPAHGVREFSTIPARNVFGLRPAPKPAETPVQPPPLPRLTLTGITTIFADKRALIVARPPSSQPGQPVRELSFILTEGQREDFLEVLEIDEKAGLVRLRNSGTLMTLTFEKNGPKPPPPAPPMPVAIAPGNRPMPPGIPTPPAGTPLVLTE